MDDNLKEYIRHAARLLKNLPEYYIDAGFETKRKIIGSIFPEKLIFEKKHIEPQDVMR